MARRALGQLARGAVVLVMTAAAAQALGAEETTYLEPNVRDHDETPGYLHVSEADMPLRVAIGLPKTPPRYGTRRDGRRVAIEAMQMWESGIQQTVPWFRLEFVEKDPEARVQIKWRRRIAGPWGGFGGMRYGVEDGRLWVGGEMEVSTTPTGDAGLEVRVTIDQLRLLIAHEFGHVLGLGHCLDCESAMNYAWHTRDRILVTELDLRTFAALVAKRNGYRVDGRPLSWLPEDREPTIDPR